ncbi:MAG: FAD-dependent oxidoreductase [Alphaproteobacteria bacterium]
MNTLNCDLLVIGAGMAGLSAAARASELGASVVVIEKAPDIGGSAMYSGGYVWTVPTLKILQGVDNGNPALGKVMVDGFRPAMAWLRQRNVMMSRPVPVFYGRGYSIDIQGHLRHCASTVSASGGHVVTKTTVTGLIQDSRGAVIGAHASHQDGDVEIRAPWTLLATGGLQGDAELRERFIGPSARDLIVRANSYSRGDGLRLAEAAGAGHSVNNRGFYGHLMAAGVMLTIDNYPRYSQIHSEQSLLFNTAGLRFTDEGLGDYANAQAAALQPGKRALLLWDDFVQRENVMRPYIEGKTPLDKLQAALDGGGSGGRFHSADDLARFAQTQGFDGRALINTFSNFNELASAAPEALAPLRTGAIRPLAEPPYYALITVPAITFAHAGIKANDQAQVLRPDNSAIPGLLVAGVDVGDVYDGGYAGGLSLALAFALRAVETAGWLAPLMHEAAGA